MFCYRLIAHTIAISFFFFCECHSILLLSIWELMDRISLPCRFLSRYNFLTMIRDICMCINRSSGALVLCFDLPVKCVWMLRIYAYGSLYSQPAFHPFPLLIRIITKLISKAIIWFIRLQDPPGSKNTVHKLTSYSRALSPFRTFLMFVACRKKAPILTSLFLAYPSTPQWLTDLGR